ncbi:CheR family methyltransferase [Paraliomyxa miuraensis]|uniref:CheR family methyltransferase n=1 Tax=Paraliomyxa miuraensis TaxID=376150 RepID=UPI002254C576|nr:CheR family methyltransferase [Paraliomyxa miuraensis]MCX4242632.1 ATP-binding protein [Paraliomyxa miuraensis]
MARTPGEEPPEPPPPADIDDVSLERLAEALEDIDLRVYKPGTITRRAHRRMASIGVDDFESYLVRLHEDREERRALAQELLISVTEMFRDPEAFDALRRLAIDPIIESLSPQESFRVWVPGCATGEEAYSIAIVVLEALAHHDHPASLQVFATDVDEEALAVGRAGLYPPTIADQVGPFRLQRYFDAIEGKGHRVTKQVRDAVSFATHDLANDPPFSRMSLVSCRNVLIYLRPPTQEQVLNLLHFALQPDGYLLLGSSESTGPRRGSFATVSKKWKIFRRVGASRLSSIARRGASTTNRREESSTSMGPQNRPGSARVRSRGGGDDRVRRAILGARVPPTIVVDESGAILYMHGELRPYLRFPEGDPRFELSDLVDPELATRVRAALYKCRREEQTVVATSSPDSSRLERIRVTATPAFEIGDGVVLVTFEPLAGPSSPHSPVDTPQQDAVIELLEKELEATREDLRSTVDELESSNEELRCANEESTSMNEELQSVNEELEATTEELRSLNEELSTVNAQLREKVEQLESAHDDIANFFSSARIATLFLDERLCIKRSTPAANELVRLDAHDQGRFVGDIARELLQNDLVQQAQQVLDHLEARADEIQTTDGRWIIRRVLPYRTETRRIEGVVVTFADVTDLKTTAEQLAVREQQHAVIARLGLRALEEPDLQTFLEHAVREVQLTLGTDLCKVLELQPGGRTLLLRAGVGWREGLVGRATVEADLDSQAGYTLQSPGVVLVEDLQQERRFKGPPFLVGYDVRSGLSCVIPGLGGPYGVLATHARSARRFSPEDAHFLQAVAAVIGSAIQHHQTHARQVLEIAVARASVEADDLADAIARFHASTSEALGLDVVELWLPSADGHALERSAIHATPPLSPHQIDRRLPPDRLELTDGMSVPCRVHLLRHAEWVTSLLPRRHFRRVEEARQLGLCSGLVFPITIGNDSIGVVVCLSREQLHADDVLLRCLEGIGRSLGELVSRKLAEADLRRSEARFRRVLMSSPVPLMVHDDTGNVVDLSRSWTELTGYSLDDIPTTEAWVHAAFREQAAELMAMQREVWDSPPHEHGYEQEIWTKGGARKTLSFLAVPLGEAADGRRLRLVSANDVTKQRRIERELVEANRQKDEFIAMLGHELRNPLAAVNSAAELLRLPQLDPERITRIQIIVERQTRHMAKLLDGLLDVSRIARGKIKVERRLLDLRSTTEGVLGDFRDSQIMGERELRCTVASEPLWAEVDSVRWIQILDNLLSNAVKYTPAPGQIEIGLEREGHHAVLVVRDSGEGIDPELLPHVFEPFRQANQSLDRARGGLGLGLALVKRLVELHGGTVRAHSEGLGKGAEFTVRIPLAKPRSASHHDPTVASSAQRILLLEDNEDAAEMLRSALELHGHEVTVAQDGTAAIELARTLALDAVLCDIGLPGDLTGFDVAATLRADPRTKHIPLIALSGYARDVDAQSSRLSGFDAHLPKPVPLDRIEHVLRMLIEAKQEVE